MKNVREAIQQIRGFRFILEQLDICSALGRRFLYEMSWLNKAEEIEKEFARISEVSALLADGTEREVLEKVRCKFMQIRDIQGTVKHTAEPCVLDELELFEIKSFALLVEEIRGLLGERLSIRLPELEPVICLLDPENKRIPHFFIYDAYSKELAGLRIELKKKRREGVAEAEIEKLYFQSVAVEDQIREELSLALRAYHSSLHQALEQIALLDIVIAKALQAEKMQFVCPQIVSSHITFKGLFNPELKEVLQQTGKAFQSVDIELFAGATLITGANMAGKTVLLKTIALAQCMMQFGFWVPAMQASMMVVDDIQSSIGDEQDDMNGLSSFAAEMLRINQMIAQIRGGRRILVLIDELARTTNPVEGQAIVNGIVDFLSGSGTIALLTTHYSGIVAPCRKLRVKGFIEEKIKGEITLKNINQFIDYSLEEDQDNEIPQEALRIAGLLGVDGEILDKMRKFLKTDSDKE